MAPNRIVLRYHFGNLCIKGLTTVHIALIELRMNWTGQRENLRLQ